MAAAPKRVFINSLVCEGCGDCSKASNCVSIEPLNTAFGRKRRIDQSTCNQDYSCVDGFCPSFITLEGATNAQAKPVPALTVDATPLPEIPAFDGVRNIVFTGIGGTGVTTTASILAMAAHVDGMASSVVDMTGLAQKGGAVFSHVRIGADEATPVAGRVPAASAHVVIACDLLVAAGPEALALYAKDRTVAVGNADFQPTADFVTNRDVRYDAVAMARRLVGACQSYDACPAAHLAESRLGDSLYANMIMLGFAWQKGLVPVSARALFRAIQLNGVAAEENLQAFEIGRMAAHDPAARGPSDNDVLTPETTPLDELIELRAGELHAYQNAAYADRYLARVAKVRAAETTFGGEALTRAAAVNLHKLMAYKDEYEVARLYTDGRFASELGDTFTGGKVKVWLAPPLMAAKGKDGRPRKMAFGGWMLTAGFPVLAKLKGLRGGPLDLFGASGERRMERGLIADYEAGLDRIVDGLTAERLPLAVKIASIPDGIRGFGFVKGGSVKTAKAAEAGLWRAWEG